MKPLTLTVSAFGPFAEEQHLDFQRLSDTPLFLIHGPTGAGKSSLLDAICFALYGETSGGEKDVKFIRSDFSKPSEETRVEFDFALGGKTYRIHRSPEQERPKKRGEGTTRQPSQATLWECRDDTRTVIADRWSKVTGEITRITGFDPGQFRQVVMLPQGQFRKFLLANSTDRQTILESLFQTERYRIIENALKESARDTKAAYEDIHRKTELILNGEDAENREALDARISEMTSRISSLTDALADLETREKQARKALEQGRSHKALLDEEQKAVLDQAQIESRQASMDFMARELVRAQKARRLTDAQTLVSERKREYDEAEFRHDQAGREARNAEQAKIKAEQAHARELARQDEVRQKKKEQAELTRLSGLLQGFVQAEADHASAESEVKIKIRARDKQKDELESLQKQIKNLTEQIRLAGETASHVDGLALTHERLKQNENRLNELKQVQSLEDKAEKDKQRAFDKLSSGEQALSREKEALEQLESAFHSGQAARLAQNLAPGKPCPVCGSTEHPAKAQSDRTLPGENELKKTRAVIKQKEEDLKTLRERSSSANEACVKQESRRKSLEQDLGDLARTDAASIRAESATVFQRLEEARDQQKRLPDLKKSLEDLTQKEAGSVQVLDQAIQSLDQAQQVKSRTLAVLEERKASIPEDLRDPALINSRLDELGTFIRTAEQALETATQNREACLNQSAAASRALFHTTETLKHARTAWTKAVEDFESRLQKQGFTDLEDYTQALRPDDTISSMDQTLRVFGEDKKAAQDRLDRARKAAKDLEMPDIPALEAQVARISQNLTEMRDEKTRTNTLLERKLKAAKDLDTLARKSADLEQHYAVAGKLADVASGRGINASGITFQRYVLAALFDDVLYTAGRHLKAMSRNRFDLEREQDRLDRRSASGLDLRVTDAHTGTSRPVSTLSGGESFLAALSLALGLADVVQNYAGGIRLDTLFIDEGFGSLDPETLDLAFKAIADLQVRGRLVGIISHVPELKERIPVRLDVIPGQRGSRAEFYGLGN